MKKSFTIGLVGNPNCGKTTLFNALTGSTQRVGNWPGVTVERKSGEFRLGEATIEVVDLPGTYSLDVVDRDISLDERVARDYVQEGEADLVINIVDASNLERNLYLTTQLVEMGVPLLVVLNMVDVAESKGMKVSVAEVAAQLGCPVLPVIASTGKGVPELKTAIGKAVEEGPRAKAAVAYSDELNTAIGKLAASIESASPAAKASPRWLAVRLLEGDDLARKIVGDAMASEARQAARQFGDDLDILVADARYSLANRTLDVVLIWLGAAGGPALIMALERGGRQALIPAAREQASLMLLLTVPAAVGLALVAAPLSQLMVGPALAQGAAQVTPWIAASGLLAGLTTYYFHQAFTLGQRTVFLLAAMALPALANLVLNLLLIPRLGLQGALIATLASYALGLAASALLGRRLMALPVPWLTLAQALGASALMALAVTRIPALGGLPELAAKAGLGALVYGLAVYLLDAGALRSRAGQALRTFRARNAA